MDEVANIKMKGFMIYDSLYKHFKELTKEQLGELVLQMVDYVENDNIPNDSSFMFETWKYSYDANKAKYLKKCRENGMKGAEYGKLGGRPPKYETEEERLEAERERKRRYFQNKKIG